MPVAVRNLEDGPAVFSDLDNGIQLEWQGKGDGAGEDVQYVPDALMQNIAFTKAMRNGIFALVTEDEAIEAVAQQQVSQEAKRADAASSARATLSPEVDNDLIQVNCIGPSTRGTGTCGEPLTVRAKASGDAPHLCPRHKALVSQYALAEVNGTITWVRATVAPRESQ